MGSNPIRGTIMGARSSAESEQRGPNAKVEGSIPSGHATQQLVARLRAQIQFRHFNESQIALAEEVIAVLQLEDLLDKYSINLVRRVAGDGNGWERVAYNGSATGFGRTAREAVEDCVRQLKE